MEEININRFIYILNKITIHNSHFFDSWRGCIGTVDEPHFSINNQTFIYERN